MKPIRPIFIVDKIPKLDQLLIDLLKDLGPDQWELPTLAGKWTVKDIATHLLDGMVRNLSIQRDGYQGDPPGAIGGYKDLVDYLNRLNADWVKATRRLSPRVLISMLETYSIVYSDYMKSIDPFAEAMFSVGWAGEGRSLNWMHLAREYTEKWHHQQQIRVATNKNPKLLLLPTWFEPHLNTSIRALPHHFKDTTGQEGDAIRFVFTGEQDYEWFLVWQRKEWRLFTATDRAFKAEVRIPDDIAWRIFTKAISKKEALEHSKIQGEERFAIPIFDMVAVMM
ncbi:MAG: maleylpyruvate isomerase N-terminal domain-containing protein [Bacteroidota bacterium]